MQLVNGKIYDVFNYIATALGFLLLGLSALAWFMPGMDNLKTLGFNPVTGVLGLAQVTYGLAFYNPRKRINQFTAALLAEMLLIANLVNLIHSTGGFRSVYMIGWLVLALVTGLFGLYVSLTFSFLITLYFILLQSDPQRLAQGQFDPVAIGIVLGTYAISAISYAVWKKFYIDSESNKVRQLSEKLGDSHAQSVKLIESITDGMIVTDDEGTITLMNPAASRMTGWPIEEAVGISAKQVVKFQHENGKDLEDGQNPYKQIAANKQPFSGNFRLVSRSNSYIIVSLGVSPIMQPDDKSISGVVAVLRDISKARADENRRADFISTASHEMRTPVAAIEGYLQLAMNDKVSNIDMKARSFLEKALDSTHHLGQLFQDLLTSAKAEDGRLVNHPRVVEMGQLLQKTTEDLRFSAEKKGLLLDFKIGASSDESALSSNKVVKPLYYSYVDPDRMQEVITNLFDNAVKYTEAGKVTVALTGDDEVVQLFIKDTGHGIPKEDVPHLFQKFYRVDNSDTRTIGGTGLGLFICKRIVELYKGRIWVESERNVGSTFYINLPRISSQKAQEMKHKEDRGEAVQPATPVVK